MANELFWLGVVAVICVTTILIFWRQDRKDRKAR